MKIITVENYQEMSVLCAEIIRDVVRAKPNAVLGLATGSTPLGAYAELCSMYNRGEVSFKNVKTVNLDEYVDVKDPTHSYAYFMKTNLFDGIDINTANTHIPNGEATDLAMECRRYDSLLDRMPRDIQLLGLGSDGHIAFNEPNSPFNGRTRVAQLADSTIKDNSRLFATIEDVPREALTMGIADIMSAKRVVVLASGLNKAQAVRAMVKGKVSESCPASILQQHSDVVVILDKLAGSLL